MTRDPTTQTPTRRGDGLRRLGLETIAALAVPLGVAAVLRSVAFDPDLPDPVADRGRFDPADPDVAFMRRVVRAALAPPVVPAPSAAPIVPAPSATASGAPVPAPVSVASSCTARS